MLPFLVFGGYVFNLEDVPIYLKWFQYLSPLRYSTEALVRNEFENNDIYANGEEVYKKLHYDLGMFWCILILLFFSVI